MNNIPKTLVRRQPGKEQQPWYLYVIECKGERLYTGITTDVDARFMTHKAGKGAKFTKAFPPKRVIFTALFKNRQTASKAEYDFKRLSADEKRRFISDQTSKEIQ